MPNPAGIKNGMNTYLRYLNSLHDGHYYWFGKEQFGVIPVKQNTSVSSFTHSFINTETGALTSVKNRHLGKRLFVSSPRHVEEIFARYTPEEITTGEFFQQRVNM